MSGFSEQRLIQRCLQKSHNHEEQLGGIAEGGSLMTTLTSDCWTLVSQSPKSQYD